jgi:hypothetical protein
LRLPAVQAPFLVSAVWGGKRVEGVSQGGELTLRTDVINLGGTAVEPALVSAVIAAVIAIAAIVIVRGMRKRVSDRS